MTFTALEARGLMRDDLDIGIEWLPLPDVAAFELGKLMLSDKGRRTCLSRCCERRWPASCLSPGKKACYEDSCNWGARELGYEIARRLDIMEAEVGSVPEDYRSCEVDCVDLAEPDIMDAGVVDAYRWLMG